MFGQLEPALAVLLLGVGLGIRHATDADHVVVMFSLVQREGGSWRAARIAALWGVGHTATFLALGLLVVLTGVRVPATFERAAELMVAAMLIGLGAWHLMPGRRLEHAPDALPRTGVARPLGIGLVHGLAGSAGVALLAVSTIDSRPLAVCYLGLVALGTVLGMVALTILLSHSIRWTMRRDGHMRASIASFAAILSMGLGFGMLLGT